MRSLLRFLLTLLSSMVIASSILCVLFPANANSDTSTDHERRSSVFSGWFTFRDPASLFSPTATISLTEDNSTFFVAKPAAFGPSLPSKGLSGQVWVGSGFGDDNVNRRGMATTIEGELGCADIPGWTNRGRVHGDRIHGETVDAPHFRSPKVSNHRSRSALKAKRDAAPIPDTLLPESQDVSNDDDGTDDFLHYSLSKISFYTGGGSKATETFISHFTEHADIQSLQEAAEIHGKVVLLSRGGCGFSEKVKWAQRRGAVAVIIADDVRGGPLVRMYARGDVSNITIPSLFTSHTTAHLLSHLIPPSVDGKARTALNDLEQIVGLFPEAQRQERKESARKSTDSTEIEEMSQVTKQGKLPKRKAVEGISHSKDGWLSSLKPTNSRVDYENSKNAGSTADWLRIDDFVDDEAWTASRKASRTANTEMTDGFVIGVQDWRDPDIVERSTNSQISRTTLPQSMKPQQTAIAIQRFGQLKGGSITPGSGEYEQPGDHLIVEVQTSKTDMPQQRTSKTYQRGWFSRLLLGVLKIGVPKDTGPSKGGFPGLVEKLSFDAQQKDDSQHSGLWVTLTPADVNSSPLLNTLFVLVVSPLVTLAVVYTMLLLRSRIRRRRWRAPKSVVERLPVRVYHTFSTRSSAATETSTPHLCSSMTPLLGVAKLEDSSAGTCIPSTSPNGSLPSSSQYGSMDPPTAEHEKVTSRLAEWKRKYEGKQRECVVCLEDYIDGVSRVMSLPCGHEFHADCITPWLTTRRRTCPICKGDVVRSIRSAAQPTPRPNEEEIRPQTAMQSRDNSPSASMPVPTRAAVYEDDLERAEMFTPSYSDIGTPSPSWLSRNLSRGLDYFGVQYHDSERTVPDRNRQ